MLKDRFVRNACENFSYSVWLVGKFNSPKPMFRSMQTLRPPSTALRCWSPQQISRSTDQKNTEHRYVSHLRNLRLEARLGMTVHGNDTRYGQALQCKTTFFGKSEIQTWLLLLPHDSHTFGSLKYGKHSLLVCRKLCADQKYLILSN